MKETSVILDLDPGIDDAVALFMLSQVKNIKIKLLVACSGNLSIQRTVSNILHFRNMFNIKADVVKGEEYPLKRVSQTAEYAHGKTGLGNYSYDASTKGASEEDYIEAIERVLKNNKNTKILCLGPLTNIANLLLKKPELKPLIKEIIFMGGDRDYSPERLPYAEFNIGFDPEAAEVVINSGIPFCMIPMNLGHYTYFNGKEIELIGKVNKLGLVFQQMFEGYKDGHVPDGNAATHDPCAAVYLISPDIYKVKKAHISLEYIKELKTGVLVVDIYSKKKPQGLIAVDMNEIKFKELFYKMLENFK